MKRLCLLLLPLVLIRCDDDDGNFKPDPGDLALHGLQIKELSPSLQGERMYIEATSPAGGIYMETSGELKKGKNFDFQAGRIKTEKDLVFKLIPGPDTRPTIRIRENLWELVEKDYEGAQTYFVDFGNNRIAFTAEVEALK